MREVSTVAPSRVSTIELFFDLVFVFTITQVTTILVRAPDGRGIAQAGLELFVVFWMYGGFAWLTNTNDPNSLSRRAVILAGMAAFFVLSLTVPTAFQQDGLTFAGSYLAVVVVHAVGFVVFGGRGALRSVARFLPFNLVASLLLLTAGFAGGALVWVLWAAAAAIELLSPALMRVGSSFAINAAHFGERHGLVVLIVLGESLVGLAIASEQHSVDTRLVVGALFGLVTLASLWWLYFDADDERAVQAMDGARPEQRPVWAINGYFVAHFVMILGVLMLAAGLRLATPDLFDRGSTATSWLVAGGVGCFALGSSGFRLALRFADPLPRAVLAFVCLAAAFVGTGWSIVAELAALTALCVVELLVESRLPRAGT